MRTTSMFIFVVTMLHTAGASAQDIKEYKSPDGVYSARITNIMKTSTSTNESIVEILEGGKTIVSQSYTSEDAEHGFGVQRQAWTSDSHFFVYSMLSSGGHQAWHSPTYFVSMKDLAVRDLDNYIGLVTSPEFKTVPPDQIETTARPIADMEHEKLVRISLGVAVAKEYK